jgi:hypothetical protein
MVNFKNLSQHLPEKNDEVHTGSCKRNIRHFEGKQNGFKFAKNQADDNPISNLDSSIVCTSLFWRGLQFTIFIFMHTFPETLT